MSFTVFELYRKLGEAIESGQGYIPCVVIDRGDYHTELCSAYVSEKYVGPEEESAEDLADDSNWQYEFFLTQD